MSFYLSCKIGHSESVSACSSTLSYLLVCWNPQGIYEIVRWSQASWRFACVYWYRYLPLSWFCLLVCIYSTDPLLSSVTHTYHLHSPTVPYGFHRSAHPWLYSTDSYSMHIDHPNSSWYISHFSLTETSRYKETYLL